MKLELRFFASLREALGISQAHVSRIKSGTYSDLPGETMRSFARFFGCSIEELFPAPSESRVA